MSKGSPLTFYHVRIRWYVAISQVVIIMMTNFYLVPEIRYNVTPRILPLILHQLNLFSLNIISDIIIISPIPANICPNHFFLSKFHQNDILQSMGSRVQSILRETSFLPVQIFLAKQFIVGFLL